VSWARLYHSNRKQGFTFELEEGRVVIEGFVNESWVDKKKSIFQLFSWIKVSFN
jgi:hypothetical protein